MTENLFEKTAYELSQGIKNGDYSSAEVTEDFIKRIESTNDAYNSFITTSFDVAREQAKNADSILSKSNDIPDLAGVPVSIKDLCVTKGIQTTAASRILEGWIPPYNAKIVENCQENLMPILGKTNLDEFAVGSSTEFSGYGPTKNSWDKNRVPGGSSGGSATAVGLGQSPVAVGTDTGGSIRQPAAFTGTVGLKPTYGAISRYGVIEMSSSLDQVGPMAKNILDLAMFFDVLRGYDSNDSTSLKELDDCGYKTSTEAALFGAKQDLKNIKIGIVPEILESDTIQQEILDNIKESIELLKSMGAEFIDVKIPTFKYAMPAYYIIMPCEFSSNMARFDGMRYGKRYEPEEGEFSSERIMSLTRKKYLGPEVKRRIILGTYALSSGYFDSYYGTAQKIRTLIIKELKEIFSKVDVLLLPTTTSTAFKFNENIDDPLKMYLNDLFTVPFNLAGTPSCALQTGVDKNNLPTSIQFATAQKCDNKLFVVSKALECAFEKKWGGPFNKVFKPNN